MYMSGNSLQIFSIMMVFMLFKGPIQGLLNTNNAFVKFETDGTRSKLRAVKLVYILMQFVLLGVGVWKVNAMGLLPYVPSQFPKTVFALSISLPVLIYIPRSLRHQTNLILQHNEVGLASLGVRTGTFGTSLFCVQMSCTGLYNEI